MDDMQLTPKQLQANLEVLYNQNENAYGAGFTDAIAHVGGLVTGIYSPEVIADAQAQMLDPDADGYSKSYADGYIPQWNRLTLLTNAALVRTDGYGAE